VRGVGGAGDPGALAGAVRDDREDASLSIGAGAAGNRRPVFPAQGSDSADGELIVGDAAGGALIAFYADGRKAQRLEPGVRQNAKRLGGQLERRGAVIVLWPHPSSPLSRSVEPCAFG